MKRPAAHFGAQGLHPPRVCWVVLHRFALFLSCAAIVVRCDRAPLDRQDVIRTACDIIKDYCEKPENPVNRMSEFVQLDLAESTGMAVHKVFQTARDTIRTPVSKDDWVEIIQDLNDAVKQRDRERVRDEFEKGQAAQGCEAVVLYDNSGTCRSNEMLWKCVTSEKGREAFGDWCDAPLFLFGDSVRQWANPEGPPPKRDRMTRFPDIPGFLVDAKAKGKVLSGGVARTKVVVVVTDGVWSEQIGDKEVPLTDENVARARSRFGHLFTFYKDTCNVPLVLFPLFLVPNRAMRDKVVKYRDSLWDGFCYPELGFHLDAIPVVAGDNPDVILDSLRAAFDAMLSNYYRCAAKEPSFFVFADGESLAVDCYLPAGTRSPPRLDVPPGSSFHLSMVDGRPRIVGLVQEAMGERDTLTVAISPVRRAFDPPNAPMRSRVLLYQDAASGGLLSLGRFPRGTVALRTRARYACGASIVMSEVGVDAPKQANPAALRLMRRAQPGSDEFVFTLPASGWLQFQAAKLTTFRTGFIPGDRTLSVMVHSADYLIPDGLLAFILPVVLIVILILMSLDWSFQRPTWHARIEKALVAWLAIFCSAFPRPYSGRCC